MSHSQLTPMKSTKNKKIDGLLARLGKQTESSGRKLRNKDDEMCTVPSNTYINYSFQPNTETKKARKSKSKINVSYCNYRKASKQNYRKNSKTEEGDE